MRALFGLSISVLCAALGACSSVPPQEPQPIVEIGAPLGVAKLTYPKGVAEVQSSVEHVLYPNNTIAGGTKNATPTVPPKNADTFSDRERQTRTASITPISTPIVVQRLPDPPVTSTQKKTPTSDEAAWMKFCDKDNAAATMTATDWRIVTQGEAPASVLKIYPDCVVEGS